MVAYELKDRLVVGIASSALFDLAEADVVFRDQGEEVYRAYQEEHLDDTLDKGVAFPFIRRLLSLNDLSPGDPLVEVIILSRNDPDTGLRVMRSIQSHGLPISRAIFMQGRSPYRFMPALNMSLFLSANEDDVREAVALGLPAGRVLGPAVADEGDDQDLRIAFDFDGVIADDASEQVYQTDGIESFRFHEAANAATPHDPGPLRDFLAGVNRLQRREEEQRAVDAEYKIRVHVSLVTARDAPAHERPVRSLKNWGVTVNDAFFLGGIDKSTIMEVLKPHIFFDDQVGHLTGTARSTPSVHVPFGKINEPALPAPGQAQQ
ncbi:5'-nucleotidase [Streptomyces europaeiscabiei]|uniref:5'-nucleotidase n=1 Tax=Streptomyces europaeiscabiei TaxID=146819 RepID=A0ABU4NTJ1_9ACTN|nr:5'-nucleotidase [Streptomyces europaeiscabiei]MDX2524621.1 5'-nucleotidase [Streptomyces europaeiscabiei]MDX3548556.1 5'-nucleotidase [Streptomyces europaeiscabiei]MDX3558200.1 5'-nucleotidase [Streptomyces europaeiscabiei]MDX3672306.1 5'-nucleotidase [Streptomyces europaeiscabiei]MDX3706029.1 5'-nucleotidase [Streptomyces europaeiscabiei]